MTHRRELDKPARYKIRVKGYFEEAWLLYWFEGFVVTEQTAGETTLTGLISDEAALHGLLAKIRDLGLNLLFLDRLEN